MQIALSLAGILVIVAAALVLISIEIKPRRRPWRQEELARGQVIFHMEGSIKVDPVRQWANSR
ncbi:MULTISPECIES: hypothetical protein [Bradyrhizobium]|uniref:hypothetical protein n=1 Tax=Bradyrhizobium TaxID=374 RepID=UPI000407E03B|nr:MULTISPECIES: hypothetical protein [Bradyrhizobium]MBR1293447.1 hypothetical protein [Bradyrhizobium ottawaense]WLB48290.1 hypothetical protein QIH93_10020 [Bradyrhizobium ottawaense]WQN85640.1 hypothetical protein U7859_15110 [Bradyrhizobium ottawaense]GMO88039.1 hypothetical protein BwSG20_77190 [Bradyrhizobium ottawaense]